jgi:transposase
VPNAALYFALTELARRWRRQHRSWRAELCENLTVWLHHRIEYADLVDKLSAWRREIYRVAAKAIAERFAIVAVDRIAMQVLARNKEMPREVRKLRGWAAPYDLAAEIRRAVAAVGGRFLEVGGATTRTCHRCGHHNVGRTDARRSDLIWQCEKCLALWDQDENAARNVLAAASGKTALVASASRARKTGLFPRARLTRKGSARKPDDNPLDNRAG